MLEVAFLRSPVAHARLHGVTKPPGADKQRIHACRLAALCVPSAPTPPCRASASPSSPRWPRASCATSAKPSPPAWPPRAPRRKISWPPASSTTRRCRRLHDMLARTAARLTADPRALVDERLPRDAARRRRVGSRRHRCRQGDAHAAHLAPVHGADRGQGSPGRMGSAPRADDRHDLDADAACHQDRSGRLPRPRRGPGAHRLARCRRRLRLQGHPAARGDRLRQHRAAARSAGALAGRPLRAAHATPTAASITTSSPRGPTAPASFWASSARPRSMPAPIPPIRSAPAWKRPKSARSCRALTCCRCCAATPSRPAPTSRRSCPIAAWRGPACATPWTPRSMPWRASSA